MKQKKYFRILGIELHTLQKSKNLRNAKGKKSQDFRRKSPEIQPTNRKNRKVDSGHSQNESNQAIKKEKKWKTNAGLQARKSERGQNYTF